MSPRVVHNLRKLARACGFYLHEVTPLNEVESFIQLLSPKDTGTDLIRVGETRDGGYLLPNDLSGIKYCFSPGVDNVSHFEASLASLGIKCFMADYSVSAPSQKREEFVFDKKYLGAINNTEFFTLAAWKDKYIKGYEGDLLLQMDIEGSEYEVLMNTPEDLLNQFRILVIEFHYLDRLLEPLVFKIYKTCIEKILQQFEVAHIHPNNHSETIKVGNLEIPETLEITFHNKKRVAASLRSRIEFPHPLDVDNCTYKKRTSLPKCWYRSATN